MNELVGLLGQMLVMRLVGLLGQMLVELFELLVLLLVRWEK